MTNAEFRTQLELRTRHFAVEVFKMLDSLPKSNSTRMIAFQLGKSASSVGANYREACRAESKDDFGHKMQLALKESSESCYWFEILYELYRSNSAIKDLHEEACQLRNLLQAIAQKVRNPSTQTPKHSNTQILLNGLPGGQPLPTQTPKHSKTQTL